VTRPHSDPLRGEALPDLFSVGAAEMIRTSQRLGLTWDLKLATVTGFAPLMLQFDGDSASAGGSAPAVQGVSIMGPIPPGIRVWALILPRGLNVVIGFATDGPRRRIGTQILVTDSATFDTTETEIGQVRVPVERDQIYYIWGSTHIGTTVANDRANLRIRRESTSGDELNLTPSLALPNAGTAGNYGSIDAEWRATYTGWTEFLLTASRAAGTGVLRREGQENRPQLLYVDWVRTWHQEAAV
jgi:hypothetical protein